MRSRRYGRRSRSRSRRRTKSRKIKKVFVSRGGYRL